MINCYQNILTYSRYPRKSVYHIRTIRINP